MKEREKKILEYMKTEIREKGYPPTVREICTALGIKSTSTVHKDIANLEKEGEPPGPGGKDLLSLSGPTPSTRHWVNYRGGDANGQ